MFQCYSRGTFTIGVIVDFYNNADANVTATILVQITSSMLQQEVTFTIILMQQLVQITSMLQ